MSRRRKPRTRRATAAVPATARSVRRSIRWRLWDWGRARFVGSARGAKLLAAPLEHLAAGIGQLADQPVRLQRVGEPGLGPAVVNAEAHGAGADLLAPFVEQRELAAGLLQATGQPGDFDRMGMV